LGLSQGGNASLDVRWDMTVGAVSTDWTIPQPLGHCRLEFEGRAQLHAHILHEVFFREEGEGGSIDGMITERLQIAKKKAFHYTEKTKPEYPTKTPFTILSRACESLPEKEKKLLARVDCLEAQKLHLSSTPKITREKGYQFTKFTQRAEVKRIH